MKSYYPPCRIDIGGCNNFHSNSCLDYGLGWLLYTIGLFVDPMCTKLGSKYRDPCDVRPLYRGTRGSDSSRVGFTIYPMEFHNEYQDILICIPERSRGANQRIRNSTSLPFISYVGHKLPLSRPLIMPPPFMKPPGCVFTCSPCCTPR